MAQKQKTTSKLFHYSEPAAKVLMGISAAVLLLTPVPLLATTDTYDAQIDATQSEVSTYKQEQVRLATVADSLEEELRRLEGQLASVNQEVSANQAEYARLSSELLYREAEVSSKSDELGAILRQSYFDSQVTPLEMIASSKTLSDYMDYYAARDNLQAEVQGNLRELKAARLAATIQKEEVQTVLRDGKAMQSTLEKTRKEQEELLNRTRGQEAAYARLAAERNANIAELRAEQLDANRTFFVSGQIIAGDPNNGGYPTKLNNAAMDSLVDPWGMYNRECVSYTAWKVQQNTGRMPYWGGRGNANEWPSSAEADGIKTGSTPKKGAVAIAFIGPYGHSMYVEEVLDGGKIRVSEYNYFLNGTYTERITSGGGLTYVYFE